jgi:hypothetical protein
MFEKPQDIIIGSYANHAHNDFLELWLEAGIAGSILIGAFAIWFVLRSAKVWRRSYREGVEIDRSLTRAATLIITLLLAHSLVDYPLRTGAMMAILAFACALLINPPISSPGEKRDPMGIEENAPRRYRRPRSSAPAHGALSSAPAPPFAVGPTASLSPSRPEAAAWDETVEWPEEWRKSSAGKISPGGARKPPGKRAED